MNQVPNKEQPDHRGGRSAFEDLCRPSFLEYSWSQVNRSNPKSAGIDHVTIGQFQAEIDDNLAVLASEIKNRTFEFGKLSGVAIAKNDAKPNGDKRPLRIPTVRDRIVLKALQLFLRPHLESLNAPFSYAYRKERGPHLAIAHARDLAKRYDFVVEVDIKKYFDNVNQARLETVLFKSHRIPTIESLLRAGLSLETEVSTTVRAQDLHLFKDADGRGIPQGSALSPILANLYLTYFDVEMSKTGIEMLRYADDIVMFAPTHKAAETAFERARQIMIGLDLDMHPLGSTPDSKSRIREIHCDGVEFVGFRLKNDRILPGPKGLARFRVDIEAATAMRGGGLHQQGTREKHPDSLIARARSLNNRVEGKAASLAPCDDSQEIRELSDLVQRAYKGMFGYVGVAFKPGDEKRVRVMEVPDLLGQWKEQRAKFEEKDPVVPPTMDEIKAWLAKAQPRVARAFKGLIKTETPAGSVAPAPALSV